MLPQMHHSITKELKWTGLLIRNLFGDEKPTHHSTIQQVRIVVRSMVLPRADFVA